MSFERQVGYSSEVSLETKDGYIELWVADIDKGSSEYCQLTPTDIEYLIQALAAELIAIRKNNG